MNEIFDKIILRIIFALFICIMLFIYRYLYHLIHPSAHGQIFHKFLPSKNSAESTHFFSRLIGIAIVFSEFHFNLNHGLSFAIFDFFIQALSGFIIFIVSLYTIDSIVLYNFEYQDEVIKRKNISFSIISLSHSLGISIILKTILTTSGTSLWMLIFLWFLSLVLIGFATKSFPIMSNLSFNRLLIQKNMALAFSYFGFFIGWSLVIASSLNFPISTIQSFGLQAILKLILSLLFLPLFIKGIKIIFYLEDDLHKKAKSESLQSNTNIELGYGIYEGATFLTAFYLSVVITGRIYFGEFYPSL